MNDFPFIIASGKGETKHGYHIPKSGSQNKELGIVRVERTQEDLMQTLDNLSNKQTESLINAGLV